MFKLMKAPEIETLKPKTMDLNMVKLSTTKMKARRGTNSQLNTTKRRYSLKFSSQNHVKQLVGFITDLPHSLEFNASMQAFHRKTLKPFPISQYVNYSRFSKSHHVFLTAISTTSESKYFSHATQDPKWREAMKSEIEALEANNTWVLTKLPKRSKAIDSKWVYKIKYKPNGEIKRFKARLVAKGYTQIEGNDFHGTFFTDGKTCYSKMCLSSCYKETMGSLPT